MRYLQLMIDRGPLSQTAVSVRAYEAPLLALLHGEEALQILGEHEVALEGAIDASEEYDRLARIYDSPVKGQPTCVQQIYGMKLEGKLERAMAAAGALDAAAGADEQLGDDSNGGARPDEDWTVAELKDVLASMSVAFSSKLPKDDLTKLARDAVIAQLEQAQAPYASDVPIEALLAQLNELRPPA